MNLHASRAGLAPDDGQRSSHPEPINSFISHTYNLSPFFSILTRPSRLTILFSNTYENRKNQRPRTKSLRKAGLASARHAPSPRSGQKTIAPGVSLGGMVRNPNRSPRSGRKTIAPGVSPGGMVRNPNRSPRSGQKTVAPGASPGKKPATRIAARVAGERR